MNYCEKLWIISLFTGRCQKNMLKSKKKLKKYLLVKKNALPLPSLTVVNINTLTYNALDSKVM